MCLSIVRHKMYLCMHQVATPGRLCELMTNGENIEAFCNLSNVRYLVVDEADRMVEEGHFPELYRIFSRIRDHEKLADKGIDPVEAEAAAKRGVDEVEEDTNMDEEEGEEGDWKESSAALGEVGDGDEAVGARSITGKKRRAVVVETAPVRVNPRQTLLFSATLLSQESNKRAPGPNAKGAAGRNKTADARFDGAVTVRPHAVAKKLLPEFLRQLVDAVAIQKSVTIVNAATANRIARATEVAVTTTTGSAKESKESSGVTTTTPQAESVQLGAATLPKGLVQVEVKMPTEEKDVLAYYYLITVGIS